MSRRHKNNIFIIDGRDRALQQTVLSFLREIGLNPVLLPGPPSPARSQTLIRRFEDWASDAYAIVLMSPEERGSETSLSRSSLFELGFLVGKLGKRYVTGIYREELELPRELSGLLSIPLDDIGIWKFALLRDLSAAGFAVRSNLAVYGPREGKAGAAPKFPDPGPVLPQAGQR